MRHVRLGVNLDHIATLRNARSRSAHAFPDLLEAARIAQQAGADGVTLHLREDRRHILDSDVERIRSQVSLPLNLEMAATHEMLQVALKILPHAVCLVPERRQERTTESGLDAVGLQSSLRHFVGRLSESGVRVSLFLDPDPEQISAASFVGADAVELHCGRYCALMEQSDQLPEPEQSWKSEQRRELQRLHTNAKKVADLGMECHAGHGLNFATAVDVASIPYVAELNIGHFLVGAAVLSGLPAAIDRMCVSIRTGVRSQDSRAGL